MCLMLQTPDATDVIIVVKEKNILSSFAGTNLTREDVGFEFSGSLTNPFGYAEVGMDFCIYVCLDGVYVMYIYLCIYV